MQWEVTVIVTGKNLSSLLETLQSLPIVEWSMKAVTGATVETISTRTKRRFNGKSKLRKIEPAGGSMADKVGVVIRKEGLPTLSRQDICKYITQIGGNPSGISYYVANLREAKILGKCDRKNNTYAVIPPK